MSEIIADKVISRIYGHGRGWVFVLSDFSDIANPSTIKNILARFTKRGLIRRLMRGVYDYPSISKLLNELSPPDPDKIAQAIARSHGWTIWPDGNTALNLLGLSTQVPSTWEYLSDGPYRSYKWLGNTMRFKHRTNKETTVLSSKSALIVQALKALGEKNVDDKVIITISNHLNEKERKKILKEAMYVTDWVYEIIKKACRLENYNNE
ncbi:MAG: DUF6088 family protein [Spirochaetales bacterium]|uniref:DUF6088 family protein n=1 Tax=Candidatus Thalassospirochaeta sargassi TaxID=3119039 RepID=A0AAJ1IES1_9SPIO|nr:DUF6088 family protein [Spirochaetales bacterium]